MNTINELSYLLQGLILAGLGARVIYICVKLTHEEDEAARYRKRLKNTIVFAVISQLPFVVKDIIVGYLGGGS